jgi:hypothetical protein
MIRLFNKNSPTSWKQKMVLFHLSFRSQHLISKEVQKNIYFLILMMMMMFNVLFNIVEEMLTLTY